MLAIVKAAVLYFLAVFGAGFVLGTMRVLWLAPLLGARTAELAEMPLMLAVMIACAVWIIRWTALPPATASRLGMGFIALALILAADFTLVLQLRGLPLERYFRELDPLTGTLYYALLGLFAVLPLLLSRSVRRRPA